MIQAFTEIPDKALSVRQPWASLIVEGILSFEVLDPNRYMKDHENRTWKTSFRGPLFIHASKNFDTTAFEKLCDIFSVADVKRFYFTHGERFHEFRGGIIGATTVADCVAKSDSFWFSGPYALVLKNSLMLPFHETKGALNFFKPELSAEYQDQLKKITYGYRHTIGFEEQPRTSFQSIRK
ncbi:ASCH domain-containing protein [Leptospira stimsonii]|uniref:ASCH domain-containing protein n=1 Tax=Leptospira stimsonii TaxID=2202203 RepID=UPI001AEFC63C|nr:ASCH domain-containing protein [Leptospira stimsonii]